MTPQAPTGGGRRYRRVTWLVVTVVMAWAVVTGCAGDRIIYEQPPPGASAPVALSTTTTTVAALPAGFTRFTSDKDHFSIALPADWRQIDPAGPGYAKAMEEYLKSNERLAQRFASVDIAAQGIKLLATGGDRDSVYVVVRPGEGAVEADLPELLEGIKAQYERVGVTIRSEETVQLSGHRALRLDLLVGLDDPNRTRRPLPEVQYILVANDLVYILTMAGESPDFPAIASTFTVT